MNSLRPPSVFSIAPGVHGFRSVMVNYYFVQVEAGGAAWVLIDAGLRWSGPRLLREAERRFGVGTKPRAIILTHGHFDHVGALSWLLSRWHVPVYAHPGELPFLNKRMPYPAPDPTVGGGFLALSSLLYPRRVGHFPTLVRPLPADGIVPALPNWRWIPTPGHSPGQVALWRESDRLLISGDALITTRQESAVAVFRQTVELRPPPAYFTPDWQQSYDSLLRLRALGPARLASGHGLPVGGEFLHYGLERLVRNFETYGLPSHGRYVPRILHTA